MKYLSRKNLILIITALVLLLGSYVLTQKTSAPVVANTIPPSDQQDVATNTSSLYLYFQSPLSSKDRSRVNVSITPMVKNSLYWFDDEQTLEIKIGEEFIKNTEYHVVINYKKNQIFELIFKTNIYNQQDLRQHVDEQIKSDQLFAEELKNTLTPYPWYSKLPLITNNYQVFFSTTTKKFQITVRENNASESTAQALDAITALTGSKPSPNEYVVIIE